MNPRQPQVVAGQVQQQPPMEPQQVSAPIVQPKPNVDLAMRDKQVQEQAVMQEQQVAKEQQQQMDQYAQGVQALQAMIADGSINQVDPEAIKQLAALGQELGRDLEADLQGAQSEQEIPQEQMAEGQQMAGSQEEQIKQLMQAGYSDEEIAQMLSQQA